MKSKQLKEQSFMIIGAMIHVHRQLGPGFLESIYHRALELEFKHQNIPFESEKEIHVQYNSTLIGTHRLDFYLYDKYILEIKTVERLDKQHYAQVRSYLKATGKEHGLLVNFSEITLDPRRIK